MNSSRTPGLLLTATASEALRSSPGQAGHISGSSSSNRGNGDRSASSSQRESLLSYCPCFKQPQRHPRRPPVRDTTEVSWDPRGIAYVQHRQRGSRLAHNIEMPDDSTTQCLHYRIMQSLHRLTCCTGTVTYNQTLQSALLYRAQLSCTMCCFGPILLPKCPQSNIPSTKSLILGGLTNMP